jgi:ankyrin
MKFYIPLFVAALSVGALVGCDRSDTDGTTTVKTETTTTHDNTAPDAHGQVTIDGDKVKEGLNKAADATKRGLEKTGDAIENAADKTKDALTPDQKVEVKTETTTTTTQP